MRVPFLIAAAVVLTAAASAAGLEDDIARCAVQSGDAARLACYDAIAAHLKSVPVAAVAAQPAPAPAAQPAPATPIAPVAAAPVAPAPVAAAAPAAKPPAATTAQAEFGAENLTETAREAAGQPAPLDEIKSGVTEVYLTLKGRFIVTLANGQIWRQIDSDTGRPRFNKNGGDTVTISRGMIGGYNLVVDGRTGLFKVARIK
jgi:hypothetical protein